MRPHRPLLTPELSTLAGAKRLGFGLVGTPSRLPRANGRPRSVFAIEDIVTIL